MKKLRYFLILTCMILCVDNVVAEIVLPQIYTDNMVLQRNSTITMSGHANPKSRVTLSADWLQESISTQANIDGYFSLRFSTPVAGGPYSMVINDGVDKKVLQNILIGEVWICSGQSNMEFPIRGAWARLMDADQIVASMHHPALRLMQIKNTTSLAPLDDAAVEYGWIESSPSAASFSAIGYLYGTMLQDSLNIPIGIIDATWGGTDIEAWTPQKSLRNVPEIKNINRLLESSLSEDELRDNIFKKLYDEYDAPQKIEYPINRALFHQEIPWKSMSVPSLWEDNGLPGLDGVVVFQYELELPQEAAGSPLQLHIGAIDDYDCTYFNGVKVGVTSGFEKARHYFVDGRYVNAGKNVITIEVVDNGGGGGIWKSSYADVNGVSYSLDGMWSYIVLSDFAKSHIKFKEPTSPNFPTVLYNAMIYPLTQMPVAGVIWYQGCNNVGRDQMYEVCFKNMIKGWREAFGKPDMPFYFVQLAGFLQPVAVQPESEWALLRQAQAKALELPNTAMASAVDLGNPIDIHPTNKAEVARRLCLLALDKTYGQRQICEAPVCIETKFEGNKALLRFDKLVKSHGGVITGFIVGDKDNNWGYANARMIDDKTIELKSVLVERPSVVRYNWADYPDGNLYGDNNLPVLPFATDK